MERSLFSFALSISLLLHTLCLGQPILNSNTDKQALISFKKYITSDPYGVGPSWSEDTPFCNWTGVSCSVKHHRVIGLGLSHLDLAGTVAPHLGNLTFLRQFDIGFNNFTGSLPELAKLRRLEVINIGSNSFTGEIPTWLGSLPRLKFVYFGSNKLSGLISSDICNNMLELSLFDNQLEGKIPTNISKCRHLDLLDLSENNLVGSIPREIGNMTMLESLSLGHNDLTGGIPSEIGNLRSLHTLDLANNQLTGFIPNIMGEMSQLATLALSSNRLIGEIPSSICNLTSSFEFLYLSNNRLDGSIPQCLEKFSRSLQVLDLGENHFDGLIPSNFTKGCSLMLLNLNMNRLEGVLPQSLVKCRRLLVLDIGNNRLEGTFPFWIQNLAYLGVLILRSNNFSGTISHTMNPSVNLQVFDISHNAFTGSVPTGYWKFFKAMKVAHEHLTSKQEWYEFFKDPFSITLKGNDASFTRILKSFTTIDLSSNRFSGTISDSIGDLISLMHLNLSHNCFTGHIPASLGNVSTLESLDLSSNQLAGKIPTQLTKLTFLSKLNLSMNNLSGQIPQFTGQFLTFENASYVGNSGLCGFPLTQKCEGSSPPEVMITEEGGGSEFLEGFCWEAVVSGYGSGFVLGVTIGYLILAYGKPKWFVDWLYGIYRIKRRRGRGNVAQRRRPSRAN